jgi:hypothetical protein
VSRVDRQSPPPLTGSPVPLPPVPLLVRPDRRPAGLPESDWPERNRRALRRPAAWLSTSAEPGGDCCQKGMTWHNPPGVDDVEPMRQYLLRLDVAARRPKCPWACAASSARWGSSPRERSGSSTPWSSGASQGLHSWDRSTACPCWPSSPACSGPRRPALRRTKYVAAARGGRCRGAPRAAHRRQRSHRRSPAVVVARLSLSADVASMVALTGLVLAYTFVRGLQFSTGASHEPPSGTS